MLSSSKVEIIYFSVSSPLFFKDFAYSSKSSIVSLSFGFCFFVSPLHCFATLMLKRTYLTFLLLAGFDYSGSGTDGKRRSMSSYISSMVGPSSFSVLGSGVQPSLSSPPLYSKILLSMCFSIASLTTFQS